MFQNQCYGASAAVAATAAILRRFAARGLLIFVVSRSRRDCGNLEADKSHEWAESVRAAAVAATAAILRRPKGVRFDVNRRNAAVAATAAILRRLCPCQYTRQIESPQSPRLRQS